MSSETILSIIIPAYNAERYVGAAIQSCLEQSAAEGWELIVVDDGSTDGTRQCVERYLGDPRVKLVAHANSGVSAARNHGIRLARGRFIALLDADDFYRPEVLEIFLKTCRDNAGTWALLYCDYERVDAAGKTIAAIRVRAPMLRPQLYEQFLLPKAFPILTSTVLARRAAILDVGGFDERFQRCEDLELWTRMIERFDMAKLDIISTGRRMHDEQVTANRAEIIHWREECNLGFLQRHHFGYFCATHDPAEQARIAEYYGDLMRGAPEPLLRTAAYLYATSLGLQVRAGVQVKLDAVRRALTANSSEHGSRSPDHA